MASSLDIKYITQGSHRGEWRIDFPPTKGPTQYNKGGSFWFASETAAKKALELYKSQTPRGLRAQLKKVLKNRTKITSAELTSAIQKIWKTSRANAGSLVYSIKNDFPEVLINAKGKTIQILGHGEVSGSNAFTNFLNEKLKTNKTIKANVGDLVKESKVDIKEPTARDVIRKNFKNKVILAKGELDVSKAIEAYKKLPEQTKIDFQTGGPGQQGAYKRWLARQGLTQEFAPAFFLKKLKEAGVYKKAPYKGSDAAKEQYVQRKGGIEKAGAAKYEKGLTDFKTKVVRDLNLPLVKQPGGGLRTPLDLAHRISFDQLAKLGGQYGAAGLGVDPFRMNRETIKAVENSLRPLYAEQVKLFNKAKKLDSIPFDLKKQIDANNNQIAEIIAKKTNGRLQGIQVNYNNLKIETTPIDYSKTIGQGVVTKPLSQIKPGSIDDAVLKLNYIEQIKRESPQNLVKQINKIAPLKKIVEARVGCAEGCLAQVAKNEPGKITRALETLPQKARGFLSLLGRGGVRAAPYAALAAAGAVIEPLVKQFRNDDPNTYLTDESQMKGMLLATIEGETPKVDEELLNWQYPGMAASAAAAIPGSSAVYKARRRPFTRQVWERNIPYGKGETASTMDRLVSTKTRAAMGVPRAALGPVGKFLAGTFSPLGVAATLPISVAAQRKGGTEWGDIATDPLNWMAPAFASTGARMATRGMPSSGILAKAIRLGISPRTLSLVSRRFGIPGLAISAGMWGYDKWKNRSINDEE
jgi:hypothetical protein